MLRITRIEGDEEVATLRVEGRLTEGAMSEFAGALAGAGAVRLDVSGILFADAAGIRAIRGAVRSGAKLTGCSGFLGELLRLEAPREGGRDLVARLRAGEEAAFETLVRLHGGRMLAVARRFLPDEQDARDVVQDALLAAFRSIGSFDGRAELSTWLHRVVVNAALMKLRSRRRRREELIDDLLPRFHEDGHRVADGPDRESASDVVLERAETRARVRRAIARLPETYRAVLVLRDIEERDTGETATLLGITPQAVKTRLHRARQALRTLLARETS
jgi:RNA polymerase sigma-70 factor (ECF subfamily)